MNYLVAACTDVGIKKDTNQDSLTIKVAETMIGTVAMAVLCDGMGGLAQGEVASADVIQAFSEWFYHRLPQLIKSGGFDDNVIRKEWEQIVQTENQRIAEYGRKNGISLGTTVVAGLFTDERYYILNVGDSRAYQIKDGVEVMTEDQTVVANEVRLGRLTKDQAEKDSRRSVLLQCIGASPVVYPDMFFGKTLRDTVYMFCSDGFRHVISEQEIFEYLNPDYLSNEKEMAEQGRILTELNKQRKEQDNISVAMLRTL